MQEPDEVTGAVTVPISLATTFAQASPGELRVSVAPLGLAAERLLKNCKIRMSGARVCLFPRAGSRTFLITKDLITLARATLRALLTKRCVPLSAGSPREIVSVIVPDYGGRTVLSLVLPVLQCYAAAENGKYGRI